MSVTWITPVDKISSAVDTAWTDIDCSAQIPSGATGVIFHYYDNRNFSDDVGWRKNGSTDDRFPAGQGDGHCWGAVGLDASRIFEFYTENKSSKNLYIVGYFTDDAAFFDNGVDKSTGTTGSYQDVDISSDTGGDTAVGAIVERAGTNAATAFRKNGSTDDRYGGVPNHQIRIIGVDGSEIFEQKIGNTGSDIYLLGYVTKESTFHTNATDVSLGSTGSWIDLTALDSGATGGYLEIYTASAFANYGIRKNGSSQNVLNPPFVRSNCALVECDASQLLEGQTGSTDIDFFVVGYSEPSAGGGSPDTPPQLLLGGIG